MKYCHRCHKITLGEPFFCNFCGASYSVKLCGRLHPNPRSAEACSQCGSRDLSLPQPRIPIILRPLFALLRLIPTLIGLSLVAGALYWAFDAVRRDPRFLQGLFCLMFLALMLGLIWRLLPKWLQGFLQASFRLIALVFKAIFHLFFSKKRDVKGGRHGA